MWYAPTIVTAPTLADEPVTLAEARAQCRTDSEDDSAHVTLLIKAARRHIEQYCGIAIAKRTIAINCDSFADFARFPVVPVSSIDQITYSGANGEEQTLDNTAYQIHRGSQGLSAKITASTGMAWPILQSGSQISVTAKVGAADEDVKLATLMLIAHWYYNREAADVDALQQIPHGVADLLCNHRVFS